MILKPKSSHRQFGRSDLWGELIEFIFRTQPKSSCKFLMGRLEVLFDSRSSPHLLTPIKPRRSNRFFIWLKDACLFGWGGKAKILLSVARMHLSTSCLVECKFSLLSALNSNEAMGRLPPLTPPKFFRHITLFLGNTLLDIFKRQLIATLVPQGAKNVAESRQKLASWPKF